MRFYLALHIIFVITWFAGTFYLPRLFVYHAMSNNKHTNETFVIMERKLFWFTTISVIAASLLGIILVTYNTNYYLRSGWFHLKITFVALLWIYHIWSYYLMKQFALGKNKKTHIWYRVFNEIPAIFLRLIIFLIIYQPSFK